MELILRDDKVIIDGYVNAVERLSNRIRERNGDTFKERIKKGAFRRSMSVHPKVELRLNHERIVGDTTDSSLELREDNIGLHAHVESNDAEIMEKGRDGKLVGWSFGFFDDGRVDRYEERGEKIRDVYDLILTEVSLLDDTRRPAYDGTLVNVREEGQTNFGDAFEGELHIRDERTPAPAEEEPEETKIDYSEFENLINNLKGEN